MSLWSGLKRLFTRRGPVIADESGPAIGPSTLSVVGGEDVDIEAFFNPTEAVKLENTDEIAAETAMKVRTREAWLAPGRAEVLRAAQQLPGPMMHIPPDAIGVAKIATLEIEGLEQQITKLIGERNEALQQKEQCARGFHYLEAEAKQLRAQIADLGSGWQNVSAILDKAKVPIFYKRTKEQHPAINRLLTMTERVDWLRKKAGRRR